jgi:SAM-dependent methyltransferase
MERHDELADEYQLRFGEITHYRAQVWRILCREFFQKFIDENATILDLGCGWGEFINSIAARNKFGMDLNPDSPNHLESEVKFVHHDCSKEWPFADGTFDAIFSSNLFEHLPTKSALASAISEAARVLKPGGKLICMGPNGDPRGLFHLCGNGETTWAAFASEIFTMSIEGRDKRTAVIPIPTADYPPRRVVRPIPGLIRAS